VRIKTKRPTISATDRAIKAARRARKLLRGDLKDREAWPLIVKLMWRGLRYEHAGLHFFYVETDDSADHTELRLYVPDFRDPYGNLPTEKSLIWHYLDSELKQWVEQSAFHCYIPEFDYDRAENDTTRPEFWRYLIERMPKIAGVEP